MTKIIFDISTLKWFENTKKLFEVKKKNKNIQFFSKVLLKFKNKQDLMWWLINLIIVLSQVSK